MGLHRLLRHPLRLIPEAGAVARLRSPPRSSAFPLPVLSSRPAFAAGFARLAAVWLSLFRRMVRPLRRTASHDPNPRHAGPAAGPGTLPRPLSEGRNPSAFRLPGSLTPRPSAGPFAVPSGHERRGRSGRLSYPSKSLSATEINRSLRTSADTAVRLHSPHLPHATTAIGGRGFARQLRERAARIAHSAIGTPRPSTNPQKCRFPGHGNRAVLQSSQCNQSGQASSLSPAKAKWNRSSDPIRRLAGSPPSLPRSIRRGAGREPTPPSRLPRHDCSVQTGTPLQGRRRVPACHPHASKVSQMTFTWPTTNDTFS